MTDPDKIARGIHIPSYALDDADKEDIWNDIAATLREYGEECVEEQYCKQPDFARWFQQGETEGYRRGVEEAVKRLVYQFGDNPNALDRGAIAVVEALQLNQEGGK